MFRDPYCSRYCSNDKHNMCYAQEEEKVVIGLVFGVHEHKRKEQNNKCGHTDPEGDTRESRRDA